MQKINIKFVSIFYFALLFMALVWGYFRGHINLFVHPDFFGTIAEQNMIQAVLLGVATAIAIIILSKLGSYYFTWAKILEVKMADMIGHLTWFEVLVLALFSGISEEMFFRGAMQPAFGLAVTSILFGLLHIGPSKEFIPWTISATIIGAVFGWYFETTGLLIAPIIAHILINLVNLVFLQKTLAEMDDLPDDDELT